MTRQLCMLLAIVLLFGAASAEEVSFYPTDDSYVKRDDPFLNFGDGPTIRLRKDKFDSYLKFNVTGVTEINTVKLVLTVAGPGEDGGSIYLVSNDFADGSGPWTEETVTENNSPSIFGTPVATVGPIPVVDAKVEINLSSVVTGNGIYSFAITSDSGEETKYYSKENIHTSDYNPILIINATPDGGAEAPVAVNDAATTPEWTPVDIDITDNDTDGDGTVEPSSVSITASASHGSEVVDDVTGVIIYTPDPGYVGMDVIKYTVEDNDGFTSNEATVTITVSEAQFSNVTFEAAVDDPDSSWGATLNDFNNDGLLDLYLSTRDVPSNRLFINNGNGTFNDQTSQYGVAAAGRLCLGVASGDYNNDGYLDIVVATDAANILYRGGANGFTDRSADGISASSAYSYAPAWGDYDNDGYLDLYLVNWNSTDEVYRNSGPGNWMFSDVTETVQVSGAPQSRAGAWADYDNDGDLDIYVCQGSSHGDEQDLLYNNDNGVFTDVAPEVGFAGAKWSKTAAWGDYDNDGDLDLALSTGEQQKNRLYRNDNGTFTDVSDLFGISTSDDSHSAAWFDYDNDGDLDLLFTRSASGLPSLLYENLGNSFVEKQDDLGLGQYNGINLGSTIGDYDNNGFLDVYLTNVAGSNTLFHNRGNSNNWIVFKLVGTTSNASAVGARVRIVADGTSQIREVSGGSNSGSQHSLPVEFGLGTATVVDSAIINWPSGIVQKLASVSIKQILTIVEPDACEPEICDGPSIFPADSSGIEGLPIESVTSDVVYVDIRVKQNDEIDAFGFVVNYDTTMLDFLSGENGTLTQGFDFFDVNEIEGRIVCGGANDEPISANSSGSLVRLIFAVECIQGQEAAISISGLADDIVGMSVCCNKVVCRNCRSDGDVNNNNALSPSDALAAFRIFLYDQTLPPANDIPDFDCELEAADVNCNGQVTPGDALEIFRAFLDERPPSDCFAAEVTPLAKQGIPQLLFESVISGPGVGPGSQEFRIVVSGERLAAVDAFGFELGYPSEQLRFVRVQRTSLTAGWSEISAVETAGGLVRVGGYNAGKQTGASEGDFVSLVFEYTGGVTSEADFTVDALYDDFEYAEISTSLNPANVIPAAFALHQNYPNPFNPETEIRYDIPKTSNDKVPVVLSIYNLRGQLVRALVDEGKTAGAYKAIWDGRSDAGLRMSTGTYFYRIEAGDFVDVKRMILVR